MNILKLKKKATFSLIALLLCSTMFYYANSVFDITGYINKQVQMLKVSEMKYMYGQNDFSGDKYYNNSDILDYSSRLGQSGSFGQGIAYNYNNTPEYLLVDKNEYVENTSIAAIIENLSKYNSIHDKLENQINQDSYRDKKLGFYYVFSYDYTMNALAELNNSIDRISAAQKVPKALLSAVLFREMMFLGQEDLLDGLPIIGGKSIGICQIGIENVRFNEQIVHGEKSLILSESDDQIKTMLQNPKHAVYFCAVQLRARAIRLTGDSDIDLNTLSEKQLKKVIENYNLSKVSVNIGPIKTKETYALETYRYYELFKDYYRLQEEDSLN